MSLQVIPVRTDIYSYTERLQLDGQVYILGLHWNPRMGAAGTWLLDLSDAVGNNLLMGVPVVNGLPLTALFQGVISGLPPGDFLVIDESGQQRDPDLANFGQGVFLEYNSVAA